jgi:hypothetical protein
MTLAEVEELLGPPASGGAPPGPGAPREWRSDDGRTRITVKFDRETGGVYEAVCHTRGRESSPSLLQRLRRLFRW